LSDDNLEFSEKYTAFMMTRTAYKRLKLYYKS